MSDKRIQLGKLGENLAAQYLQKNGYKIIIRNYRKKFGEIDIIAKQGSVLIFVEVKTRNSTVKGTPFGAVTFKKQIQISRVAQEYLSTNNLIEIDARFDVVSVLIKRNSKPQIELLQNAFELCYGF